MTEGAEGAENLQICVTSLMNSPLWNVLYSKKEDSPVSWGNLIDLEKNFNLYGDQINSSFKSNHCDEIDSSCSKCIEKFEFDRKRLNLYSKWSKESKKVNIYQLFYINWIFSLLIDSFELFIDFFDLLMVLFWSFNWK